DLQQGFYLSPGNTADDDVAPTVKEPVPVPVVAAPVVATNTKTNSSKPKTTATTKPKPKPKDPEVVQPADDGNPKFIDNIELNNERTFGDNPTASEPEEAVTAIPNSDCPKPVNRSEYEEVLKKAR